MKLTIFFPAGDFFEALRRHRDGERQFYATHDEVARLLLDLEAAGVAVDVFSMAGAEAYERQWSDRIRITQFTGDSVNSPAVASAFDREDGDGIIVHYPHRNLLGRAAKSKARALADLGVREDKLIAWDVPHPYDPSQFAPKALGAQEPRKIAYAGSIAESKGVGDLLEATAAMLANGLQVRLDIAGDGAALPDMKERAGRLGIDGEVTFHGAVANDRVLGFFRDADVVVLPSRDGYSEAFPLTLFEAIASRTPVVCSSHPTFRAVLRDGVDACIFTSEDPADCARVVERLLGDADLYGRLSHAADRTWMRFKGPVDWRTMVKTWFFKGPDDPWLEQSKLHRHPDLQTRLAAQEADAA